MPEGVKCPYPIIKDLGRLDYDLALDIQLSTVDAKIKEPDMPDQIFFVEHPPVFTLGKNGGMENLTVSESFLASKGIRIIKTGRGGNITYHCPGQIVVYPIINLEKRKLGVKEFVYHLEETMIQTAMCFDIRADRNHLNHGIWVNSRKLGSIGLGIKKNISFHGMALNINSDMEPFYWINPCGLEGISMTSLKTELKKSSHKKLNISMPFIKEQLKKNLIAFLNQ